MTQSLIQRLEAAGEGSRELGYEVLLACGWTYTETALRREPRMVDPRGSVFAYREAPNPTLSVDAALMLVPEGWTALVDYIPSGINRHIGTFVSVGNAGLKHEPLFCVHRNIAPALALCIAALRARGIP